MKTNSRHQHHGYGVYLVTWLTLLVLTVITVTVAGMSLGSLSVFTAVFIAAVKASAVLYFFMHLREESTLFKVMVFVSLTTLTIFIGLTFFDTLFR